MSLEVDSISNFLGHGQEFENSLHILSRLKLKVSTFKKSKINVDDGYSNFDEWLQPFEAAIISSMISAYIKPNQHGKIKTLTNMSSQPQKARKKEDIKLKI